MSTPTSKERRARRAQTIRTRVSGTAAKPRLAVFRSLQATYASLIDDVAGVTIASANDLTAKKGTKMERAKAVGAKIAELAKAKGIQTIVFDRAGFRYAGRVQALADAAREHGLQF